MARATISRTAQQQGQKQKRESSSEVSHRAMPSGPQAEILALQGTVGNRAVNRLLRSDSSNLPMIQTKLTISQPGDKYEQEADRVAEQVMRMPEPDLQRQADEEEAEEFLQTKSLGRRRFAGDTSGSEALSIVHEVLSSTGQPLDQGVRRFMESRFGHDFSQVRVHADVKAAESAQALDALAYTIGRNIVFAAGQYAPGTTTGRNLLAHELVHIVQQAVPARNSHDLTIRRRNGFRPPPRRPPRRQGGRRGQRPGKRKPRSERARRESFERRERARLESARRKFEEEVRRSQEQLERWAKEGSEPKTPRERAIRAILKFWEFWDSLSTSWDKTHKSFDNLLVRRANLEKQGHGLEMIKDVKSRLGGSLTPELFRISRELTELDKGIEQIWKMLQDFDRKFFERVIEWGGRVQAWRERISQRGLSITVALDFGVLLFEYVATIIVFEEKLRRIDFGIGSIDVRLSMLMPIRFEPPQPSYTVPDSQAG